LKISSEKLLSEEVIKELKKLELRTYRLLKYIDEGHVFGHSPFRTILPKPGWNAELEHCDFKDLNAIREQRNKFIHAVENSNILPIEEHKKERLYERSMWVLRQFAGNLNQDVIRLQTERS
jgi:hypothetical protein